MTETLPRPQVIFFDVYGTIAKYSRPPRQVLADALRSRGVQADPDVVFRKQREIERQFPPHDEYPSDGEWQYWRHYDGELLMRLGVPISQEALDAIRHGFEESLTVDPAPEAHASLAALKAAGATLGIISNSNFGVRRDLARMDLARYFDPIVFSQAVGARKPDPHLFLVALSKVGCPPTRAWMVGNDPNTDVRGARGVGMVPILVDASGESDPSATTVVSSLHEVVDLYETSEP